MITKQLIFSYLISLIVFSCSEKDHSPSLANEAEFKTAAPKVTVLANLPDSSKPVKIFLKKPVRKIKADQPIIHSFLDSNTHMVMPPEEQAAGFFTNYTTDDGLALDAITCSFADKDGNLWFGTDGGGVSRYDGRSFTNYTVEHGLPSNQIFTIRQDRSGDLWFGTRSGASRFDGRSFRNYTNEHGLTHTVVFSICEDKLGKLWFGTAGGGLSSYNGRKFVHLTKAHGLAGNDVSVIAEDRSGNLWIGTENGISRSDGEGFITRLHNHHITSIAADDQNNIWVGTSRGLFRYGEKEFSSDSGTVKFPIKNITCITKDRTGNLWIGTQGDGVIRYDGSTFTRLTTNNGLSTNKVKSISEDKTGNLWFGTDAGLVRYGGKSFMNYTTAHGLDYNDFLFGMVGDKAGGLWIGTNGKGVCHYDGKNFSTYTLSQGLVSSYAMPLFKDKKGDLWIGNSGGGVSCFDGKSFTNYTQADGLCSNHPRCIIETRNGKMWFGTYEGATCYDGKSFVNYSGVHGLPNNDIWCITEDAAGGIWFGTDEGVSRFNDSSFFNYSMANGLANNTVVCSAIDRCGNLWFGTMGGGVSRFDGNSFMNFTVGQGLPNNNVWAIVIDSADKIIFGTNAGLAVLVHFNHNAATEKESLTRPAQNDLKNDDLKNYIPQFEIYNVSAGYPIKDVNPYSMVEDSKGDLWMGTGGGKTGLIRFNYSSVHKDKEPPVPVLHNVKINDENVSWQVLLPQFPGKDSGKSKSGPYIMEELTTFGFIFTEKDRDSMRTKFKGIKFDSIRPFYPIPENLVLPYRYNNIAFDFGSVELNSPNLVRYQYILEGYDKEWHSIANRTSVTFGNLQEGTYVFKLQAKNQFSKWSDPVEYTFEVLPPWWQTWWFRIGVVVCALSVFYGLIRWRLHQKFTRQLEQSKKEKQLAELEQQKTELEMQALRSQMNPHFIFNSLNSINRFILQNNRTQASEYLTKFSKLIRLILQNSQASLISLESELQTLELYLDLEALRFDHRFGYKISVPKDLDIEALQVPPLIIQPYTENAIWHGLMHKEDKGQLDIEVSEENDHLYFKIADNGIGRKQAAAMASKSATKHKSMGLRITQDRIAMLQKINGESPVKIIDLENADGSAAGTEVIIKMPLIYD